MKQPIMERLDSGETLLYDGGVGTELQRRGVEEPNSFESVKKNPNVLRHIIFDYKEAGSDIIETPTYGASSCIAQSNGSGVIEYIGMVHRAVNIAQEITGDSDVLLAGSIGPLGKIIELKEYDSINNNMYISLPRAKSIFFEIAKALNEELVDFFQIESMTDSREALAAYEACSQFNIPISVSYGFLAGTLKTSFGESPEDIVNSYGEDVPDVFGVNCIEDVQNAARIISLYNEATAKPLMACPNAGMPTIDDQNRTQYPDSPEHMASQVPLLINEGAQIIGGCCGTTPDHIKAFRKVIDIM